MECERSAASGFAAPRRSTLPILPTWNFPPMARHRNCQGISRRDCLKFGLGGFVGAGLGDLSSMRRTASAESTEAVTAKAKSCILIWLDGGPTHYETFDPKPESPNEVRGEFDPISTKVPGLFYSEHMV